MDQAQTEPNTDYLDIGNIIAIDKVNRLIRKIHTFAKKDTVVINKQGEIQTKERYRTIMDLDKQQIIEHYKTIQTAFKDHRSIRRKGTDSPIKEYVTTKAYQLSALVIREKALLQVREWHESRTVMIFETLTIADEYISNSEALTNALKEYKDNLRKNNCKYLIVLEFGSKKGRPHWHALYNSPHGIIKSLGQWSIGQPDVRRVRYLGDGITSPKTCIERQWSLERVAAYMTSYITQEIEKKQNQDDFTFRTQLSRGFGTWKLRQKLKKMKTEKLMKIVHSGTRRYMKILQIEVQKEYSRRLYIPKSALTRDLTTPESCAIQEAVGSQKRTCGHFRKTSRKQFKGLKKYEAI